MSNLAVTTAHCYLRIAWNIRKPALNLFECHLSQKTVVVYEIPMQNGNTETTLDFPAQECDLCTNGHGMSTE